MSLLRGRRATLLKAILTPTATTRVKEITPPITYAVLLVRGGNTLTHSPRERDKSSNREEVQTLTCCCAAGASQSPGRACSPRARWRAAACRPTRGRCSCCRSPGPAGSSGARSRSGSGRCRSSRCSCPWSSWTWCQSAPSRRSNPCGSKSQSVLVLKRVVIALDPGLMQNWHV